MGLFKCIYLIAAVAAASTAASTAVSTAASTATSHYYIVATVLA
jgi:hypothetical protein